MNEFLKRGLRHFWTGGLSVHPMYGGCPHEVVFKSFNSEVYHTSAMDFFFLAKTRLQT